MNRYILQSSKQKYDWQLPSSIARAIHFEQGIHSPKVTRTSDDGNSPRARNRFNQVVEAKRSEGVFLCRKMC